MNTIHTLTLRSLLMNKSRTAMTIIAILLSCALITVIAGMGTSALHGLLMARIHFSGNYDVSFEGRFDDEGIENLSRNRDVYGVYYQRPEGIAAIPEPKSVYKPYLLLHGVSADALEDCFQASLSEGRLPETDNEIVLSPMFVKYSQKAYHIGDTLTLSLGDRHITGGNSRILPHTAGFIEGEFLDSQQTKEYTIVGLLDSVSRASLCPDASACVDVFTLCESVRGTWTTEGFSQDVNKLYVRYTEAAEKNYVSATAQIVGISEEQTIRHLDNEYDLSTVASDENGQPLPSGSFRTEREQALDTFSRSNSFGIRDFYENQSLLQAKGIFRKQSAMDTITLIALILIFIVMGTSVFIIRNSISISATEKTRLFGMLSSVGATPRQIRNSILYEGLLLTLIGIPLGIALGAGVTFALTTLSGEILKRSLNGNTLAFFLPLWTLAAAALLGAGTVFLSSVSVAVKASKVTPMEAVRQTGSVTLRQTKAEKNYRTPKLIGRLFGEGGVIAWKNMKRSRRQYRVTVISLAVSTILFLSVTTCVEAGFRAAREAIDDKTYDLYLHGATMGSWDDPNYPEGTERPNPTEEYRQFFEKVAQNSHVSSYHYSFDTREYRFSIPEQEIYPYQTKGIPDIPVEIGHHDNREAELDIVAVDEETYADIIRLTGKTAEEMKGKAVILNVNRWIEMPDDRTRIITYQPFLKHPEGMTLQGQLSKEDDAFPEYTGDRGTISLEIGAAIDSEYHSDIESVIRPSVYSGVLILSLKDYMQTVENWYSCGFMEIMADDAVQLEADIGEMGFDRSLYVENMESYAASMNAVMLVTKILVYGFFSVITLISVTNIFNTITTNMKLRQREMAMLRSVGMTNREFNGMILLESIFYSGKAMLFGMPTGLFFGWIICFLMDFMTNANASGHSCYVFPITETILCAAAVILMVGLMMYYSVSKIRKQNIIETIRNENI